MTDVSLNVGGWSYAGWKTARVTRSLEAISGTFELSVAERWLGQAQKWPIRKFDSCSIDVAGQRVITGYVDTRELSFGSEEHSVSVSGRDATGELVDASVFLDHWSFKNVGVLDMAKKICAPHGVRVSAQVGLTLPGPLKKFALDPGETAFNALENLCRVAGLLPMSDGHGGIVLTRAGTERCKTALVEGQNILSGRATSDAKGRFARYVVLGQNSNADGSGNESTTSAVRGEALDQTVPRSSRVLVVRPETAVTPAQARARAEWEAATRAARGDTFSVTVAGWTQGDGSLWPVNKLVRITAPSLDLDGELLVTQVVHSLSVAEGTRTELSLRFPAAFLPVPVVKATPGNNYWPETVRGV